MTYFNLQKCLKPHFIDAFPNYLSIIINNLNNSIQEWICLGEEMMEAFIRISRGDTNINRHKFSISRLSYMLQRFFKKSKEPKKENHNYEEIDNSVFKKTEVIDKAKIKEILSNIKSSTKLEQIQAFALELNISIVSGATKDGKPKNKTKNELYESIIQYF